MKHTLTATIGIMLLCLAFNIAGCAQRVVSYNPDTGAWQYKSNSFATDAQAGRIRIETPSGITIEIDRINQKNDSVKVKVDPLTKSVEVETDKGE